MKSKTNVTIMGSGNTLQECKWNEPDTTYWAISSTLISSFFKHADLLFEFHSENYYLQPNILSRLNDTHLPVMMKHKVEQIPLSIPFPVKDVVIRPYFTSSVAYILAYAIYKKFEVINLFGIDLLLKDEYDTQRASCEYWIGVAEGKGIKVNIPQGSGLFNSPLYSYTRKELE